MNVFSALKRNHFYFYLTQEDAGRRKDMVKIRVLASQVVTMRIVLGADIVNA